MTSNVSNPKTGIKPTPSVNNKNTVLKKGLAFRPFFWLGSMFFLVALSVWWLFWHGQLVLMPYGGMLWWHQHEMLFGFVAAIIAGFLLTSVQNWTGLPSLVGLRLWALVFIWALARLFLAYPMGLPVLFIIFIDALFLPLVAVFIASLVIKTKRWRNVIITPVLLLLAFANVSMHIGSLHNNNELVVQSAFFAVWLIVCLILLIGGRVIPFFVSRGLGRPQVAAPKNRESLVFVSAAALCLLQFLRVLDFSVPAVVFVTPLISLSILNVWRLATWELQHCWREPLLWGLQLSYAFVIIGSAMWILSEFAILPVDLALHALTVGAMMTIIFAMIARVGLGHTGRRIRALPGIGIAIGLLLLAGLLRSVLLIFLPEAALWAYRTSLLLAIVSYTLFIVHYTKILWTPRPDGKAG